jgi:Uma2 family endonuclease
MLTPMVSTDPFPRRAFTAEEVWRMVDVGVIQPDEHVELLQGELVVVTPQGPAHASLTTTLRTRLERAFGVGFHVRNHSPVVGTVDSIPEPDVAVVRGDPRTFVARHPDAGDVPLVAEVAKTSLAIDRRKAVVYAQAGYATYWLIDVEARQVEVRTEPHDGLYTRTEVVAENGELAVPVVGGTVRASELLP